MIFLRRVFMLKKIFLLGLISVCESSLAATTINLHHAPLDTIKQFNLIQEKSKALKATSTASSSTANALQQKNQTEPRLTSFTRLDSIMHR